MHEVTTVWGEHLQTVVLPWWEGAVRPDGGVHTCVDNSGVRVSDQLYTWSQGRWAWLCAELADEARAGRLELDPASWDARARDTASLIVAHALLPDGTVIFRMTDAGEPIPDPTGRVSTSVFADLFAALGLAGAARITSLDDPRRVVWVTAAERILTNAARTIADRTAPSEPYPVPNGFADLAGPMTLLHAASELLRADDSAIAHRVRDAAWDDLIGSDGFLGDEEWWEFRPHDPAEESMLARHRTPGHLLELLWMMQHSTAQAAERGDSTPTLSLEHAARLARRAYRIGVDERDGGLLRYVDRDGGPPRGDLSGAQPAPYEGLVQRTWDTKLWWVHVEALYATGLLADLADDDELRRCHAELAEYTLRVFPDPDGNEWLQIRARNGAPLDDVVALPVKDPFHIARSLLFLHRHELSRTSTVPELSAP